MQSQLFDSSDQEKVDEAAAGHLGEVAELETGHSGVLTLTLKPGTRILYCDIPSTTRLECGPSCLVVSRTLSVNIAILLGAIG